MSLHSVSILTGISSCRTAFIVSWLLFFFYYNVFVHRYKRNLRWIFESFCFSENARMLAVRFYDGIDGSVSFHISYKALLSLPILSVFIMFLKYALKVSAIFLSSDKISLSSTRVMLEFGKCFLQWIMEINCFRKQHAISCAIVSLSL